MWLGRPTISALEHQLIGFWFAELVYRIPPSDQFSGFDFDAFEQWVKTRFNPRRLTVRSFGLARELCETERDAFDQWFKWYDQFIAEAAA